MIIADAILAVVKSVRFYLWILLFMALGIGMRLLPIQVQSMACSAYTEWIEGPVTEKIRELFSDAAMNEVGIVLNDKNGTCEAVTEDELAASINSIEQTWFTSEQFCESVRSVICSPHLGVVPEKDEFNDFWKRDPATIWGELLQMLSGSIVLAILLVAALPGGRSGARSTDDTPGAAPMVPVDRLHFRRNTRLHVGLVYAIGSCVACILVPPDYSALRPFEFSKQAWHIVALLAAGVIASLWGAQRYAKTNAACWSVAMQIGFAGVFAAGLISLLIAMPYRIMTSIESAQITLTQLKIFTAIRLLLVPIVAAGAASLLLICLRRFYLRVPVRLLP